MGKPKKNAADSSNHPISDHVDVSNLSASFVDYSWIVDGERVDINTIETDHLLCIFFTADNIVKKESELIQQKQDKVNKYSKHLLGIKEVLSKRGITNIENHRRTTGARIPRNRD